MTNQSAVEIRRSGERFHTKTFWLDSKHSFSFGPHYDRDNTNFGLLVVSNDDIVRPGSGFSTHGHRDMEIVTWVLNGELEHKDSEGHRGLIVPGMAQRMSAGRGILHSEMNNSGITPVHFIQMWVLPDTDSINPGYEEKDIRDLIKRGGLFPIASGRNLDGAIRIHQREAGLWGARMNEGETVTLPDSAYVHVYVAQGNIELESVGNLNSGDAARLTSAGPRRVTAKANGSEILLWEFTAA
jgi:redox-sensitive bicupin YhaK (pirin superfamily)